MYSERSSLPSGPSGRKRDSSQKSTTPRFAKRFWQARPHLMFLTSMDGAVRVPQIKELAGKLNLQREDVILWLKLRSADDSLATYVTKKGGKFVPMVPDKPARNAQREESGAPERRSTTSGRPYRWWEETRRWGDRKLSRDQRKTLERVFEQNRYPDVSSSSYKPCFYVLV